MAVRPRTLVWSYFDLLDPNRTYVIPAGYSRVQVAAASLDWGVTAEQIGLRFDPAGTDTNTDGTPIPMGLNTRWLTPNGQMFSYVTANNGSTTAQSLKGTFPGNYFTSFSTTYATRIPPFVSLVIEGLDAPDGRVAVLSPACQHIDNGQNGVVFNVVDKNMKVRLVDPWGRTINNLTFSATITLLP
ncbi:MAG: hypothetical protein K2K53_06485 [Oscillospiraceae bacterium]|nr:hypothetical protein [Oscillospiraceae bacterium]